MRRRQGFTLVELLVAMALIIFIMAILSEAFAAAMGTFRNLKALGDMAEKLRATTQLLQRDLAADHFEGKRRLSDPNFWLTGPPQQGFFNIWQGGATVPEGSDLDGVGSYRSTDHTMAFTVKLRGNQMSNFLSASGGMGAISNTGVFGPPEARYQNTSGGSYNYQWAEVDWFLQPSYNASGLPETTSDGTTPLYILYRRQRLLVPDNNMVPTQSAANAANFLEMSYWTNGGNLYFNSPIDLTVPQRRVMGVSNPYTPLPTTGLGSLSGSDIQLTDVVSFDVRVLSLAPSPVTNGIDPFVMLSSLMGSYTYTPPPWIVKGTVFDTWSSLSDAYSNYSQWNQLPGVPGVTVPFWNGTSGPIIQAIQISIRIWDYKTNQTRQVTIVQAM